MGVAKAVGDFLKVEKCLPLEDLEDAKITSNLVNEFSEQSIKIMKDSDINKKRNEQNKKQLSCILLRDAGNKYPDVPPINEKHEMKFSCIVDMPVIDDDFVCMYGDSIFNFSLRSMIKQHVMKKSFVTMSLNEYKTNLPYGVIETSKNGKVVSWNEKPEIKANVNIGCYVMNPNIFNLIPKNKTYGMDDVIKKAMKNKQTVNSFITKKGFTDIGNKESYKQACDEYERKQEKLK